MSKRSQQPNAAEQTQPLPVLYSARWIDELEADTGLKKRNSSVEVAEIRAIERTNAEYVFNSRFRIFDKCSNRHRISEVQHVLSAPDDYYCDVSATPAGAIGSLIKVLQNSIDYDRRAIIRDTERINAAKAIQAKYLKPAKRRK